MKASLIFNAAILSLSGATSALQLICYANGLSSSIGKGDIEYALKNRAPDLGIPGGTKFTYNWKTCTDPNGNPKVVAVVNTPAISKEGTAKLANGLVVCSRSGPPDSRC